MVLNDEIEEREHLSLVSEICTELENHLGLNDRDIAELIIYLATENPTPDGFKQALRENRGDLSDAFMDNLLQIIQDRKEDVNIELVEENRPFLQNHNRTVPDWSPVQIFRNPDRPLAFAARERRHRFDEEIVVFPRENDEREDVEIEIDVIEENCSFLQDYNRIFRNLSPVPVVRNPNGSLALAAMTQGALARERREQRMLQRQLEAGEAPLASRENEP
ncbi:ATP-dependent RNA helicase DHX8-like [Cotesia glomerata]|uniref:Uncharacterized protein n=1 Tax=Cotesia glomerata TaxID=32391 RepID=A0AAV7IRM6_COTGL|nr:ATP-dependent RNA helicase DHX8-like [Cotesia glomerata]KAH0567484.1 hypothetical protein KQX54_010376 [Cotesia glomerata]